MIMLSVLILCILTIRASCESIQCQSYDDCLRKFKQFFKTQKEIYAISQDFVYSTRGDTQPGFAVFLEGKEKELKKGEIKYISKVNTLHTEENFLFEFFMEYISKNFQKNVKGHQATTVMEKKTKNFLQSGPTNEKEQTKKQNNLEDELEQNANKNRIENKKENDIKELTEAGTQQKKGLFPKLEKYEAPAREREKSAPKLRVQFTEFEKYEELLQSLEGIFIIYTASMPCMYCLENYLNLAKKLPKTKFSVFYTIRYNTGKTNLIDSYKSQTGKLLKNYSKHSLIFPSINERLINDNLVNQYLHNYDILTGIDIGTQDDLNVNLPSNLNILRIFNYRNYENLFTFLRKKILPFDPNVPNAAGVKNKQNQETNTKQNVKIKQQPPK